MELEFKYLLKPNKKIEALIQYIKNELNRNFSIEKKEKATCLSIKLTFNEHLEVKDLINKLKLFI